MAEEITYRAMQHGEEGVICRMIKAVFDEFVAPDYSERGWHSFRSYAHPEEMRLRALDDHFVRVALTDDTIVGMIEMRQYHHVSLLFVAAAYQGRGISRQLFEQALAMCHEHNNALQAVTVNSSPYAIPIYEKLGFQQMQPETIAGGMRTTLMQYTLTQQ